MISAILRYGLSEGISKISPFVFLLFAAKELGSEQFGKLSLWVVYLEGMYLILSNSIQSVTRVAYYKKPKDELENFLIISIMYAITVVVLLLVGATYLGLWYLAVVLAIISVVRTYSSYYLSIFQCSLKAATYTNTVILYSMLYLIIGLIGLKHGLGIYSWLLAVFIASIGQAVYVWTQVKRIEVLKILFVLKGLKNNLNAAISDLKFGWMLLPAAIGWWLKAAGERMLIDKYFPSGDLGLYAFATQIGTILIIFSSSVNLALVPKLNISLKEGKSKEVFKVFAYWHLIAPCIAVSIFIASKLLLGSSLLINGYKESIAILAYILPGATLHSLIIIMGNVLYFFRNEKYMTVTILTSFLLFAAIIYIALNYVKMSLSNFALYTNLPLIVIYLAVFLSVVKSLKNGLNFKN